MVLHAEQGLRGIPATVAEIGPGDSLGVGLAALLSGAERYMALDTIRYAEAGRNGSVLDELIRLFRERAPIPDETEFPDVMPRLSTYRFPEHLFPRGALDRSLRPERVDRIRRALLAPADANGGGGCILYAAPWTDPKIIESDAADLIVSQAVLEHVEDLDGTYRAMHRWLRPGGRMSHVIDFSSHGLTRVWNGHWGLPETAWRLIKGKRPYLINRQPLSAHLRHLDRLGFTTLAVAPRSGPPGLGRANLARKFSQVTVEDLNVSCAFVAAEKPRPAAETPAPG